MAVTLSGMSEIKHVVLIHGMGGRGDYWAPARAAFLECALVAGGAVRDRGGDQRLERVELGVGQQVVDHDEAVRAERQMRSTTTRTSQPSSSPHCQGKGDGNVCNTSHALVAFIEKAGR